MKNGILDLPELVAMDARDSLIRIPAEQDVPVTPRIRRLIDTDVFRRLSRIPQLGFVSFVYPGARHTRFEHSLGVYRLALLFLRRLIQDRRFAQIINRKDAELFLAAALLHDVGHCPHCHLIEDLQLPDYRSHEERAKDFLCSGQISELLKSDWNIDPKNILCLLNHWRPNRLDEESDAEYERRCCSFRILDSILSGPIDIDKMDYLMRDSLAAGVPYGRHFDQERLIGSLCLNERGDGLAVSEKGKTATELMVFARYVMFSEVYWHHAVRAASVMFQRAFCILHPYLPLDNFDGSEFEMYEKMKLFCQNAHTKHELLNLQAQENRQTENCQTENYQMENRLSEIREAEELLDALFGSQRRLYKRVQQFSVMEEPALYKQLSGQSYQNLQNLTARLVKKINRRYNQIFGQNSSSQEECLPVQMPRPLRNSDILIDVSPAKKEIEFKIDIWHPREKKYLALSDVSPVVRALAKEQFDDYVKRIRIFAHPEVVVFLRSLPDFHEIFLSLLTESADF